MQKSEADPEVKKAALEALTSLVNGPNLHMVLEMIGDIEQFALQESKVRPELIEEIDLGPFK